jgi:hypothetical protein
LAIAAVAREVAVTLPPKLVQDYGLPGAQVMVLVSDQGPAVILHAVTFGTPHVVDMVVMPLFNANGDANPKALVSLARSRKLRVPVFDLEYLVQGQEQLLMAVANATKRQPALFAARGDFKDRTFQLGIDFGSGAKELAKASTRLGVRGWKYDLEFTLDEEAVKQLQQGVREQNLFVSVTSPASCRVAVEDYRLAASLGAESALRALNKVKNKAGVEDGGVLLSLRDGGTGKGELVLQSFLTRELRLDIQQRPGAKAIPETLFNSLVVSIANGLQATASEDDLKAKTMAVMLGNGVVLTGGLNKIQETTGRLLKDMESRKVDSMEVNTSGNVGVPGIVSLGGSFGSKTMTEVYKKDLEDVAKGLKGDIAMFNKLTINSTGEAVQRAAVNWVVTSSTTTRELRFFTQNWSFQQLEGERLARAAQAKEAEEELEKRQIVSVEVDINIGADDKKPKSFFHLRLTYEDGKTHWSKTITCPEVEVKWDEGTSHTVKIPLDAADQKLLLADRGRMRLDVAYTTDRGDAALADFTVRYRAGDAKFSGKSKKSASGEYKDTRSDRVMDAPQYKTVLEFGLSQEK